MIERRARQGCAGTVRITNHGPVRQSRRFIVQEYTAILHGRRAVVASVGRGVDFGVRLDRHIGPPERSMRSTLDSIRLTREGLTNTKERRLRTIV